MQVRKAADNSLSLYEFLKTHLSFFSDEQAICQSLLFVYFNLLEKSYLPCDSTRMNLRGS